MPLLKTNILNPLDPEQTEYLPHTYIKITGSRIEQIITHCPEPDYIDLSGYLCLPGFIDAHVHLSQLHSRGRFSASLMPWLRDHIFSEENKSQNLDFAHQISIDFFHELIRNGTTTAVIYTAPFFAACNIAFQTASEMGVRIIMGKTMMDNSNSYHLQENTDQSFQESVTLCERWHKATPLLEYAFSPRFAPVCSSRLLHMVGDFTTKNNIFIQTHISENLQEIKMVRELFPNFRNYAEVYEAHNLLHSRTLLAHAIHMEEAELKIIRNHNSKIIHCPDSNFFLKSGTFPLDKIKKAGIAFALGTDVGAGTSLSMLNTMKMYNYRQPEQTVTPSEAFYRATLAGAASLGKDDHLGSIIAGKEADLTFIEIPDLAQKSKEDLLSDLLFLGDKFRVKSVWIAGKSVYQAN
ncbi:MAG: guanine deaminase [Candidatus Cloacimonetes bacterium]|nr:guanine deaminase [Candidatus Cloacimonadota bacterium]